MDLNRKHRVFGTTAGEYIASICDDPMDDGVSAFGIWAFARFGMRFTETEIREFALRAIEALLESGAVPAKPCEEGPYFFAPEQGYDGPPAVVANNIVAEWEGNAADPDHGWHWFFRFPAAREKNA